jgi:hypothetical protein
LAIEIGNIFKFPIINKLILTTCNK